MSVPQTLLAKALQYALTQMIRIALAMIREVDNCLGDDFVNVIAGRCRRL
jgi:hypothetical protein